MNYLLRFKQELTRRTDVRGQAEWYSLRACNYMDRMSLPKIVFPDIATVPRFAMDTVGYLVPDGAFFISTDDFALLCILNSCVADYYFRLRCSTIGNPNRKGRLRFKKTYVSDFPVPARSPSNTSVFDELAAIGKDRACGVNDTATDHAVDQLVFRLYDMPKQVEDDILTRRR